jgi:hypothetical protein
MIQKVKKMFGKIADAFEVEGLDPAARLVLVAMANRASRAGECWASGALLSADTGYSLRTIEETRRRLAADGLIVDTGKRRGRTGRAVVFAVLPNAATTALLQGAANAATDAANAATDAGNAAAVADDPVHDPIKNPSPGALRAREGVSEGGHPREAVALAYQGEPWGLYVNERGRCLETAKNERRGRKAIAAAKTEQQCDSCERDVLGQAIYFDPETGRVEHQTCSDEHSTIAGLIGAVHRIGAGVHDGSTCRHCGERFKRGDLVDRGEAGTLGHVRCNPEWDAAA